MKNTIQTLVQKNENYYENENKTEVKLFGKDKSSRINMKNEKNYLDTCSEKWKQVKGRYK